MSKDYPVVFSFGGAEHHLTLQEAAAAIGRLNAGVAAAMAAQERDTRATRALLADLELAMRDLITQLDQGGVA